LSRLEGRTAIVTGAGTGIGRSIARAYAAEGAFVVLAARRVDKLEALQAEIAGSGGEALACPTDVTAEAEVEALFARASEAHGRIDVLVNNAGINVRGATDELTVEDWRRVLEVNLTGVFLCSRAALRIMKRQRSGRIINIGSISAKIPRVHSAPYTTSKFGLEGLTRSLALDGREHGIAVSILHPGNTATPIWDGREAQGRQEGLMSPDDLARVAVVMASLPPEVNVLESVVLPVSMPFLGRG
jgi:NAD(P)-dependent dehydrogenase (short-subunit alcohol dehydrogenase family)